MFFLKRLLSFRFSFSTTAANASAVNIKRRGLQEFFENGEAFPKFNPEKRIVYGRAWRTEELRLKSFEDLHSLWYVLLKERNLLATQELEARRLNQTWYGYQRDYKCRLSMARIKTVLTERMRLHQLALKAQERMQKEELTEEGELWVEWDEMEKSKIFWGKPWFRKRQRALRRIHPMF